MLGKGFKDKIKDVSIGKILKAFFTGKSTHVAMIVTQYILITINGCSFKEAFARSQSLCLCQVIGEGDDMSRNEDN